jgi:hypothetical protein
MRFGSTRFSAFLDTGNVYQKRDQIFSEVDATSLGLIVQEIEPKFILCAKIAPIRLSPSALEIRAPEIGFIGFNPVSDIPTEATQIRYAESRHKRYAVRSQQESRRIG